MDLSEDFTVELLDMINSSKKGKVDFSILIDMIALAKADNDFHAIEKVYIKQVGRNLKFRLVSNQLLSPTILFLHLVIIRILKTFLVFNSENWLYPPDTTFAPHQNHEDGSTQRLIRKDGIRQNNLIFDHSGHRDPVYLYPS